MGFVNYHGDKQDNYEAIVELAKESEKVQAEKNRKKAQASYFGVPELGTLSSKEILIQLVLHYKKVKRKHDEVISKSHNNNFDDRQTFADLWLFTLSTLLNQSVLNLDKKIKVTEELITKAFKLDSSTDASEHFSGIEKNLIYRSYMRNSFANDVDCVAYWRWIACLEKDNQLETGRVYDVFLRTYRILAFYLNQIFPEQGIGIKSLDNWEKKEASLKSVVLEANSRINATETFNNPLYNVDGSKRTTPDASQNNEPCSLCTKYKRVIVGGSMNLDENLLVGALYRNYNEGKIPEEPIPSILSEKYREILRTGNLLEVSFENNDLQLAADESLHYFENAICFIPLDNKGSLFQSLHGTVYLTNYQIVFQSVSKLFKLCFEDIERVVLYDSHPVVMEFTGKSDYMILRTADTEETYKLIKAINNGTNQKRETLRNLEKLSMEEFRKDTLDSYSFSINELCDANLPDEMKEALLAVDAAIKALINALEQYPSESARSYKFKEYYIPELITLIYSYLEYSKAKVNDKVIGPVYSKIMNALADVESAAKQRINEIYSVATLGTKARAEALQRLLGQDGLIDE